jgi:hypothetical protein
VGGDGVVGNFWLNTVSGEVFEKTGVATWTSRGNILEETPVMTGADGINPGTQGSVPAPAALDNTKFLRGDAVWADPAGGAAMVGATGLANGAGGTVPAPLAGQQFRLLRGDATWADLTGTVPVYTDEYFVDGVYGDDAQAILDISRPFKTIQALMNYLGHPTSKQDAVRNIKVHVHGAHSSVAGLNSTADSNFDGVYIEGAVATPLWIPARYITFYGRGVKIGNTNQASGFGNIINEMSTARRFGATSSELRVGTHFIGDLVARDTHNRIRGGFHIGGDFRQMIIKRTLDSIQGDPSGPNDRVTISVAAGQNPYSIPISPSASAPVTFQDTGDTVTLPGHGWSNSVSASQQVFFKSIVGTTGISIDTYYYIVNRTANTFQLSNSIGGAAIPLTTDGSGVIMQKNDWAPTISGLATLENLANIIVAGTTNYNGSYFIIEQLTPTSFLAKRLTGTNTSSALEVAGNFTETDSTGVATGLTHDAGFFNTYMQGKFSCDDGTINGAAATAGSCTFYSVGSRLLGGIRGSTINIQRMNQTTFVGTCNAGNILSYSRTANVVTALTTSTLDWAAGDIVIIAASDNGATNINGTFLLTGGNLGTLTFTQVGGDYGSTVPTGTSTISARSRFAGWGSMENCSLSGGFINASFTNSTDDMCWMNNKWQANAILHTTATGTPISNFRMDGVTYQSMITNGAFWNFPVTFQDAGDTVTRTAHGLSVGATVSFLNITSTTGIVTGTTYFVITATANTFQLAATSGGAALPLTTNGTGIMQVVPSQLSTIHTYLDQDASIKNTSNVVGVTVKDALNTIGQGSIGIFRQTNTVTVGGTIVETTLSGTGVGSLTIPANFFYVGRTLEIKGYGFRSSVASVGLRIRIKLGATTLLDTLVQTVTNTTNTMFMLDAMVTCRTLGVAGTIIGQATLTDALHPSPDTLAMVNLATTAFNTTLDQTLTITAEWDNANVGNTISLTNMLVRG